jgi:ribosomal protein S18 acetylase RimI-like enzyme
LDNGIRLGRLSQCTFEQALELKKRGFDGYHEEMAVHYPGFIRPPASTGEPVPGELDRFLDGFGTQGIRPELSIVGYADDMPVGFVFIAVKQAEGKKLGWNGGTGVYSDFRGRGIAKAMMLEANKVIREQEIDRAILEVVVKNEHAVTAYQKGGFQIADKLVGMTHAGSDLDFGGGTASDYGLRLEYGQPSDVAELSFYRDKAAWWCMWHNMKQGESLLAYDREGHAVGYALFHRSYTESGELGSITLRQCEVSEQYEDRDSLFRLLLAEVYGKFNTACTYRTVDLSMSNPIVIALHETVGFITNYEQYLMIMEKEQ